MSKTYQVVLADDAAERFEEYKVKQGGDISNSAILGKLVASGLDAEERKGEEREMREVFRECIDEYLRAERRENDAVVDRAVDRLNTATQKVNGIKKQVNIASSASLGAMYGTQVLIESMASGRDRSAVAHLKSEDLFRFLYQMGRAWALEEGGVDDFWHAWRHIEEKVGTEDVSLANLMLKGDKEQADGLMGLNDSYGQKVVARRQGKAYRKKQDDGE